MNDLEVSLESKKSNLSVRPLSTLYQSNEPQQGLILGFAAIDNDDIEAAVCKLAEIIDRLS